MGGYNTPDTGET